VDTADLAEYMSRVSLKDKEISQLVQEKNALVQEKNQLAQEKSQLVQDKNQLDKTNQERLEKIGRLKTKLMGRDFTKGNPAFSIGFNLRRSWEVLERLKEIGGEKVLHLFSSRKA
jgi:FtsZ-binding cell division protein ZapB